MLNLDEGTSVNSATTYSVIGADIRQLENLHVALWLLKDVSWCSDWHWLSLAAAIPTMALAARLCWLSRHSVTELAHNGAVCLWICANITWMIGEFYYQDMTRPLAKVFFFSGVAVLGAYYAWRLTQRGENLARS
jgi:hypothetical protein